MTEQSAKPTVMVVDDTPANLQLLKAILEEEGFSVRAFPRGAMALKAIEAEPPDLILLDINMPEMDGYEVCRRLKEADSLRNIPVIFLSASRETAVRQRALEVGGADYLVKPFQVEEVRACIETHLAASRCQQDLRRQNRRIEEALHESRSSARTTVPDFEQTVTDLRKAKDEAQASNYIFESILDGSGHTFITIDEHGKILSCNPAGERMFGYLVSDIVGEPVHLLIPSPDRERHNAYLASYLRTGQKKIIGIGRDVEALRRDGSTIPVHLTVTEVRAENGKHIFAGILEDITQRKQAEEALRYRASFEDLVSRISSRFIKLRADEIDQGIEEALAELAAFLGGDRAYILRFNDSMTHFSMTHLWRDGTSGPPKDEMQDLEFLAQLRLLAVIARDQNVTIRHPDELPVEQRSILERSGICSLVIVSMEHQDRVRDLLGVSCLHQRDWSDDDVAALQMVGQTFTNVLQRKEDDQQLLRARDRAEASNRAKSVFLANMSHEIRTPMNAVLGFAQLIEEDGSVPQTQRERARSIVRNGQRLLDLINDILEMSKIEAERVRLSLHTHDLHTLMKELDTEFRARANEKGLQLLIEWSDSSPRYVKTDRIKLHNVLAQLLSNAVKFTDRGSVTLRVETRKNPKGGLLLAAEATDTGRGIANEFLEKVFEAFEQLESDIGVHEGTGLGLTISRRYAQLLGGDLTVSSEVGVGSCFRLEIPIDEADDTDRLEREARRVVGLREASPQPRILIADDHADNRRLLAQTLQRLGLEVREASNGEEAIAAFEDWSPHLVLMDLKMPVMDGWEAIRRIKATAGGRETQIIAVTASIFDDDRENVLAIGADDIVSKPYELGEIFAVLKRNLGLEYLYEDEDEDDVRSVATQTLQELQYAAKTLPPSLVDQMRRAALSGRTARLQELVDEISRHDAKLADGLRECVNRFDYERVLEALESDRE